MAEHICPTSPSHGTMTPRAGAQTAEQQWCGQWFDCPHCKASVLEPSDALAKQKSESVNNAAFFANVLWIDRKGAGRGRGFGDPAKLEEFVARLRRDADIKNGRGELIGRVWKAEHDGNRGKWRWGYDSEAASLSATK